MESLLEDRLWESLFKEAQIALKEGQLGKAVSDFRAAVKVCQNFDPEDERTVRSMTGLGVAYSMQKDFKSAMPFFEQALRLTQQIKGAKSPECLSLLKQLAVATSAVKDFVASASYYDQAIGIYKELSPDHPDVAVLKDRRNESLRMLEKQKQMGTPHVVEDSYERDARNMQVLSGRKSPPSESAPTSTAGGTEDGAFNVPTAASASSAKPQPKPQEVIRDFEETGTLLPGVLIDNKYQVLHAVGEGGMGTIFAGKHVALERDVAIKVMQKKAIYDDSDRERFRQEAKLLSKLMHPNIVSVHDFGETSTFYYLIMDFVDGECLSARITKFGRVDVEDTVNMLMQLCDGLAHAHQKGILHRDLKPSNVMLVDQPGKPELVKLVDFGIAKSLNQTEEKMQLTQDGETIGSPLYMSPEQCRGEALDERSDIYSLGCLAYKALTGVTPFTGKNHFEIYIKHTQEMPLPFAEVAGAAKIPRALEAVLFKCLAKEPEQRFSSMLELKNALESLKL
jgi:tRNA A-37 threonylcarbamoyl transferase component Bud32